jgi:hypothetical protein
MWGFLLKADSRPDEGKLVLASNLLSCPFLELGGYAGTRPFGDQLAVIGAKLIRDFAERVQRRVLPSAFNVGQGGAGQSRHLGDGVL